MMLTWEHFLRALREYIEAERLLVPGDSVVLGVSGGRDSMLLLESMSALRGALGLRALRVVTVDHGLRPQETPDEIEFVRGRAESLGVAFESCAVVLERLDGSVQDAARRARREALEEIARACGDALIATGHHADDQAETVLLRLLRGTTPRGLGGIWPRQGRWIHPLLSFSREELTSLCEQRGVRWLEDPSNDSLNYRRNRIRHELLPGLEEVYHPQVAVHLGRLSEQARADEVYFEAQVDGCLVPPLVTALGGGWSLALEAWEVLPEALRWRVLRRLVWEVSGRGLQHHQLVHLLELAKGREGEKIASLPLGCEVLRSYGALFFLPSGTLEGLVSGECVVELKGEGEVQTAWGSLCVERCGSLESVGEERWEVYLGAAEFEGFGWELRNRREGDWLEFDWGHRALKRWMIDQKIPRSWRGSVPLICVGGRVCWVVGWRVLRPLQREVCEGGWRLRFRPSGALTQLVEVCFNSKR